MRLLAVTLLLLFAIPLLAFAAEPTVIPDLESGTTVGQATIEVNGRPTRFTQYQGYSIRRASLTDRMGRLVGRSHLICILVSSSERGCHGTYVFPRGNIMVSGIVQTNGYVLAIVGGTGFYNNARGAMRVSPSGAQERHRAFFQLVG